MTLRQKILAFDPDLPLEHASTIPRGWYRDRDVYDAERRTVFGRTWLAVGRAAAVQAPGSFLTECIADEPILVVRDLAGTLRAFYNVCRHRAAPVMRLACGTASRLRCPYHGWTYDLTGRLRGAPEFDDVADFRREDNGLVPLAVDVWGPFVWVHPGEPVLSLAEYLAPWPEQLAGLGMEQLRWVESRSYDCECNWKVFVDNFVDGGYHINAVHPGLAGVLDYTRYRTEIAAFTSAQISPLSAAGAEGAAAEVARVREGFAYYCWAFPNVMINVYRGYMDTNLVLPLGPERCRVAYDFYFADVEGPEAQRRMKDAIAVSDRIQIEDMSICAEVQRGLASRAFETGRYSVRREGAVYAFHRLLARYLRSEAAAPP